MPQTPLRIIQRIASNFPYGTYHGYVLGKLATDPVYPAVVERLLPTDRPLIDLGCGLGLCGYVLREHGYTAPVLGIDRDQKKIAMARRVIAKRYQPMTVRVQDVADPEALRPEHGEPGHIVMLDVLHYVAPEARRDLLMRIGEAVAPGGWAILRLSPKDDSWRHRLVEFEERMLQRTRWMKVPPQRFPTIDEVVEPFTALGFEAEVRPLWGRTPFNSHLFAFRKPA